MSQPTPQEKTSGRQGKLEVHRIYEHTSETGTCEKCQQFAPFCFTIEGFPNSKLCQPCGIYCKKFPTAFISKDVWSEPCLELYRWYLRFIISILGISIFIGNLNGMVCTLLFCTIFNLVMLVMTANKRCRSRDGSLRALHNYVAKWSSLASRIYLSKADYLEDAMHVTHHRMNQKLSAREEEVTKFSNELQDLKEEMADLKQQQCDAQEDHSSQEVSISTVNSSGDDSSSESPHLQNTSDSVDEDSSSDESDFIVVPSVSGEASSAV